MFSPKGGGLLGAIMAELAKDTTARFGYTFDRSPVVERSIGPLFPDTTRNSITMGMTKKHGSLDLSMYYQAMFFNRVTSNIPANEAQGTNGLYKNFANLIGMGMRWRVGGHDGKLD